MVDTILIEEDILPLAEDVSGHGIDLRTHGELIFCGVRLKKQVCLDPTASSYGLGFRMTLESGSGEA